MSSEFTEEQILFFKDFLLKHSGYNLVIGKEYLLQSRLKIVLDMHKLDNYNAIMNALRFHPHGDIATDVIEAMTVNETFFFRDDKPFEMFENSILPRLAEANDGNTIRIWSGASSTGQEPYSVAISLEEARKKYTSLKYEIDASDINNRILAKARKGHYSEMEINRGLDPKFKDKYFDHVDNEWVVKQEIKNKITFFRQNLRDEFKQSRGPYDLIFLRNVLIYFDADTKNEVLAKTVKMMRPGGVLILGVSENVYDLSLGLKKNNNTTGIYIKE